MSRKPRVDRSPEEKWQIKQPLPSQGAPFWNSEFFASLNQTSLKDSDLGGGTKHEPV
jgi:hypothetical protein